MVLRLVIFWSGLLAQAEDSRARIKGSNIPFQSTECAFWEGACGQCSLQRILLLADVQSAWSLLLHCAGGRANYLLRVVKQELVGRLLGHNEGWECLKRIMKFEGDRAWFWRVLDLNPSSPGKTVDFGTDFSLSFFFPPKKKVDFGTVDLPQCQEPLSQKETVDFGTVDLPECQEQRRQAQKHKKISVFYTTTPPLWLLQSWEVWNGMWTCHQHWPQSISGVEGCEPPSWETLVQGVHPQECEPDDFEPGGTLQFRGRAMLWSQSGNLAGTPLAAVLSTCHCCRVFLSRRLRLPLPLSSRPVNAVGVLGRRGFQWRVWEGPEAAQRH